MPESRLATLEQRQAIAKRLLESFAALAAGESARLNPIIPAASCRKESVLRVTSPPNIDARANRPMADRKKGSERAVTSERFMLFAPPLVRAILEGRKTMTRRLVSPQPLPGEPKGLCPAGQPGDRIWVREKWGYRDQFFDREALPRGPYVYAADEPPPGATYSPWKPSLHMPRAACRVVLQITAVRWERVAAISADDARAEGCPPLQLGDPIAWFRGVWDHYYGKQGLGWTADPWVWVVAFTITQK